MGSKEGKIIVESPLNGFIDANGNVIFNLYFGKITSTNRPRLSSDGTKLEGNFTNTAGIKDEVYLVKDKFK